MAFYWHTHADYKDGGSSLGSASPSLADIKVQDEMQQSGYKGNAFVIGIRVNKVSYYNKDSVIITFPYPIFRKLGIK